jgi:aspartate/methionine/tyrosine aminotransferase
VLPESFLIQVITLAEKHNILLFSDEVFAPLFHGSATAPPLITLGYSNTISTGSVSKAQGLAGIRIGWLVSPNRNLIEQIMTMRDYTTISVSQLDETIATFALSPAVLPRLMQRNLAVCQRTICVLEDFVRTNPLRCRWVRPAGAGTAFICILDRVAGRPVDDVAFVSEFVERHGVSLVPGGHCFSDEGAGDFTGYVRISLGDEDVLKKGLPLLQQYLDES